MREVVDHRYLAAATGRRARAHVSKHYDQRVVAKHVLDHLRRACALQITRQRPPRSRPPALPPFRFHSRRLGGNLTYDAIHRDKCGPLDAYHCAA